MVKLGLRVVALVGLVVLGSAAVVALSFNASTPKYSYLGGILDKHARLRATASPRIILVGGSGLAFGVDSPRVEKATGLPVVNMALHAALGLRYMLREVQPELEQGDIVVISAEYDQFYGYFDGRETLLDMLFVFPQGIQYFSAPQQFATVIEGFPISMQEMVRGALDRALFGNRQRNPVYRRDAFNAEGDVVSHLDQPLQEISDARISLDGELKQDAVTAVGDFARQAEDKGARVFYLFPAMPALQFQTIRQQTQDLCHALEAQPGVTLLAAPDEYTFPSSYFFDTVYHLNRQGRQARTERLIADLKIGLDGGKTVNCDLL